MVQESMEMWEQGLARVTDAIAGLEGKITQRLDNLEASDEKINQRLDRIDQILSILMEERTSLGERKEKVGEMRKKRAIVSKGPQQEDFKEDRGNRNTQEEDLEAFFKGLRAEFPPLDMLQRAVQNDIIHSFKPTSTDEIHEKIGKGMCELCDEYVTEAELWNTNTVIRHVHFSSYIKIGRKN
ncbi:unnamed protein product [Amaranthus hypochondriacus]